MKLFENYISARQKYGTELVETLTQNGLPPQFLLSACRFIAENGVPQQMTEHGEPLILDRKNLVIHLVFLTTLVICQ